MTISSRPCVAPTSCMVFGSGFENGSAARARGATANTAAIATTKVFLNCRCIRTTSLSVIVHCHFSGVLPVYTEHLGLGDFLKRRSRLYGLCCRRRLLTPKSGLETPPIKDDRPPRVSTFPEVALSFCSRSRQHRADILGRKLKQFPCHLPYYDTL